MRLIDAEALFKEEREEYRNNACYISTDYEHIFAEIDNAPTVEDKPQGDLETIRHEIKKKLYRDSEWNEWVIRENDVMDIIDKHL